jgi:hypothetical protein
MFVTDACNDLESRVFTVAHVRAVHCAAMHLARLKPKTLGWMA